MSSSPSLPSLQTLQSTLTSSPPNLLPLFYSTLTFPAVLQISQLLQSTLQISTSDRLPPLGLPRKMTSGPLTPFNRLSNLIRPSCTVIGCLTIITAGLASSYVYDTMSAHPTSGNTLTNRDYYAHIVRTCLLTSLIFRGLGGRLVSTSPSSLIARGAFYRKGIPATMEYATTAEKIKLSKIFRAYGCHTCGYRPGVMPLTSPLKFHADHVPPLSVVKYLNSKGWRGLINKKISQVFAPQCTNCSKQQGGALSNRLKDGVWKGVNGESIKHFRTRMFWGTGFFVNILKGDNAAVYEGRKVGGWERWRKVEREVEERLERIWKR
ncbi:hypothetical protein TrLO_g7693 [Triparma laevis f. longispina]|uniref:Uncharacterized protein n=1 Tax=Triparma laevis f. longispina TaxID=1714387 RepID=A0A9W6ZT26_9STRA|nr:hypothetical protein TrLO_g7693 [Triparma laevis f. longispina]